MIFGKDRDDNRVRGAADGKDDAQSQWLANIN